MAIQRIITWAGVISFVVAVSGVHADSSAAQRGRAALTDRALVAPLWPPNVYEDAWQHWDVDKKPKNYAEAFRARYGLHRASYPNEELPLGIRTSKGGLFPKGGLTIDCNICHSSSLFGETIIGLPNSSLDMQALQEEFTAAAGKGRYTPYPMSNVRGTTEAAAMSLSLISLRDAELNLQLPVTLDIQTDLCEDPPAWWLLKKKKTMYHTGSTDARSVRSLMQFLLTPYARPDEIKREEDTFRDIQAFLLSLEPPRYPFEIDEELAGQGEELFGKTCARCHGTYGPDGQYPNKVVSLDIIGTDPKRYHGFSKRALDHFTASWFAQEIGSDGQRLRYMDDGGYQAPPLDGVWATAPYFHNGSVPTIYHVLDSGARPGRFTRTYRTNEESYDKKRLGWKIVELESVPENITPLELRKIYDTAQPGRGNSGHEFGDLLSEQERMAVIEYLKTL